MRDSVADAPQDDGPQDEGPASWELVAASRPRQHERPGHVVSAPLGAAPRPSPVAPSVRPAARGAWTARATEARLLSPLFDAGPLQIGTIAVLAAGAFAVLRVVVAAHGNPGGFVVAGSRYVSVTRYTRTLPINAGTGYDGQFYYRLSLDPLEWSRRAFGVQLDNTGRLERVAYPAIVWVLSAGDPSAVPVVMIVVNVAALGALAAL
ncbi:MAG TPA: hypothetical protein VEJ84_08670, partial [Acidimicrobiales bacterium]|nr:hypothetical protein [Acidimicrobiales bacterium]